jgi:ParB family chromosome partitioning protein
MTKRIPLRRRGAAIKSAVSGEYKEYVLYSGTIATFELKKLSHDELVNTAFVDEMVNGREQDNITSDNISSVSGSIEQTQFYPCYVIKVGGRYEFIDGSRRLAGAIEKGVGLECFISEDEFTIADKIHLAAQLQTAKEHNFREQGIKIQNFINAESIEQQEAAKVFGHSTATISRLLKAASISKELLRIFPDRDLITLDGYGKLAKVEKELAKQEIPVPVFLDEHQINIDEALALEFPLTEKTKTLIDVIVDALFKKETVEKEVAKEFTLANYDDKNKYAKAISQGDKIQFMFKGLKPDITKQIEDFIRSKIQ